MLLDRIKLGRATDFNRRAADTFRDGTGRVDAPLVSGNIEAPTDNGVIDISFHGNFQVGIGDHLEGEQVSQATASAATVGLKALTPSRHCHWI